MNRPGREFKKRQTTKNTNEICKRYGEGENFEKIQGESLYHTLSMLFLDSLFGELTKIRA